MTSTPEGRPWSLLVAALFTGLAVGALVAAVVKSEAIDEPVRSVRSKVDGFKVLLTILVVLALLETVIYGANLEPFG